MLVMTTGTMAAIISRPAHHTCAMIRLMTLIKLTIMYMKLSVSAKPINTLSSGVLWFLGAVTRSTRSHFSGSSIQAYSSLARFSSISGRSFERKPFIMRTLQKSVSRLPRTLNEVIKTIIAMGKTILSMPAEPPAMDMAVFTNWAVTSAVTAGMKD